MTEKFSGGRCDRCGTRVGLEDGVRQEACLCDPWCESCVRQFHAGFSRRICDECLEKEIENEFSDAFLKSLSRKQMSLLFREFARRFE